MSSEPIVVIGIGQEGPAGLSPEAPQPHRSGPKFWPAAGGIWSSFPSSRPANPRSMATFRALVEDLKRPTRQRKDRRPGLRRSAVLWHRRGAGGGVAGRSIDVSAACFQRAVGVRPAQGKLARSPRSSACTVDLWRRFFRCSTLRPAKIAVLTDPENHPARIASFLVRTGPTNDYALWVCEDLGGPAERVTCWTCVQHCGTRVRAVERAGADCELRTRDNQTPRRCRCWAFRTEQFRMPAFAAA